MSSPEDARTDASAPGAPLVASLKERLVTGSMYSLIAIIVGKSLGMVTSVIYARLLGAEDLGVFLIYLQVAGLAVAFAGLGLGTAVTKLVAQLRVQDRTKLGESLSTVVTVTLVSSTMVAVAVFGLADALGRSVYGNGTLAVMIQIFSIFLILNVLSMVGSSILQGFQAIRRLALVGIVLEAVGVPVAVVSLLAFGLLGAVFGGVLAAFVGVALIFGSAVRLWRKERIRVRISFHRDAARDLLLYSAPLLVSTLVLRMALLFQSSYLALALGFSEAGLFKVASTLYAVVLLIPSAISVPLLPLASELYATASPRRAKASLTSLIRMTSYVGVAFALAVGLAARPLVELLFGSQFRDVAPLVFVLAIAGFMEIIGRVGSDAVLGEGRTSLLLRIDLVLALSIIVATVFFVNWFGLMGMGYTVLSTTALYSSILLAKLSADGRISLAPLAKAFLLASAGFVLAAVGVVLGNAQGNPWVGVAIVSAYIAAVLAFMDPRDRVVLTGVAGSLFGGVRR
jgi:O-antigen/teichoic acid export membrane protein